MDFYGFYVLNLQPTILSFVGAPFPTPDWLRPHALIEHVPWWHGTTFSMLRRKYQQLLHEKAGIHHSLMVHAPDEDAKRRFLRVKGRFISQNIYIDVNTFTLKPTKKSYNAIYVAQLEPYKRHHLARDVEQLLLVAGDPRERERYQSIFPHASFNDQRLTKVEVADALNSAICSLALSKVEGGMLASFESLLCGIPVVSTHSRGGRDVFFDSYNSILVDETPEAVSKAVRHFQLNPPDPALIRAKALADLEFHRVQFCNYISEVSVTLGGVKVDPGARYEAYFDAPRGLIDYFISPDKFDRRPDVERINSVAFRG
jgi:glycosyltransferase involved in cell wall biosynthesis